ncbi:MAG TPA: MoaD/ThiS family protein [Terriglobales bacterium]|nr:MoaD/ThiS family protein [Terriglobales bacterium]
MSDVKVTVVYMGQAREVAKTKEEEVVLTSPAKVQHAIANVVVTHPKLAELMETIKLLTNGKWTTADADLKNGDRLTLLPPVGGG